MGSGGSKVRASALGDGRFVRIKEMSDLTSADKGDDWSSRMDSTCGQVGIVCGGKSATNSLVTVPPQGEGRNYWHYPHSALVVLDDDEVGDALKETLRRCARLRGNAIVRVVRPQGDEEEDADDGSSSSESSSSSSDSGSSHKERVGQVGIVSEYSDKMCNVVFHADGELPDMEQIPVAWLQRVFDLDDLGSRRVRRLRRATRFVRKARKNPVRPGDPSSARAMMQRVQAYIAYDSSVERDSDEESCDDEAPRERPATTPVATGSRMQQIEERVAALKEVVTAIHGATC